VAKKTAITPIRHRFLRRSAYQVDHGTRLHASAGAERRALTGAVALRQAFGCRRLSGGLTKNESPKNERPKVNRHP
jgi:hypothetical protein